MDHSTIAIIVGVYGMISLLFLTETYLEGLRSRPAWDFWRASGLMFCLAWPVQALVVGAAVFWIGAVKRDALNRAV